MGAALAVAVAVAFSGCSAKTAKATQTVVQTVTQSASETPAVSDTGTDVATDSESAGPAETDTADPSDSPSGPVVIGPGHQGATLTLVDFFAPNSDWSQDSYDVASRKGLQGISANVSGCGQGDEHDLQLRLGDNYKTLTFYVGQANDSASSDQTLVVDVFTNSRQILSRKIPFNVVQPFNVPVSSVNAVVLSFHLDYNDRDCNGSLNPVIFSPVLS